MDLESDVELGSVLVIGGSGFVGSHIAQYLVQQPSCTQVSVLSRNPDRNKHPKVSYYAGDLLNPSDLGETIEKIRPVVIIHAACPPATSASADTYRKVIVDGTSTILGIALRAAFVRALIYTSSATMAAGSAHVNLDEGCPLADMDPQSHPYAKSKAIADKMVLNANTPYSEDGKEGLLTACIRLPIVYGQRDAVSIPGCLGALEKNQTNIVLGDGTNLWDFASGRNAAYAHYILAQALMKRASNVSATEVDGEAFNITDGLRQRFWDFPRLTWQAAGWVPPDDYKPTKLAPAFLLVIAFCLEWAYYIFTLGQKRPTTMSRQQVEYSCFEHTYCIGKAKDRLRYEPQVDFEKDVREATQWSLEHGGWAAKLAGQKFRRNK